MHSLVIGAGAIGGCCWTFSAGEISDPKGGRDPVTEPSFECYLGRWCRLRPAHNLSVAAPAEASGRGTAERLSRHSGQARNAVCMARSN
jgi:hypothetical protein